MRRGVLALPLLALAKPVMAAPGADPWPFWETHNDANRQVIEQPVWAGFLRRYVRPGGATASRLAYAEVTAADREALRADLIRLTALPISTYSRAEQRAYWINLYNELTVATVLAHMPVSSITKIDISPGIFSSGPWDAKLITVEGTKLSLNDIEHRILRPIWRDPRTHYTVNCASMGCPNLAVEPYSAVAMEAMLDRGAREFVNAPRGARVEDGKLIASRIYDWYQADFGGSEAGVIAHLKRYAGPELTRALDGVRGVSRYEYDWGLNAP
jgi:hypothetical protein